MARQGLIPGNPVASAAAPAHSLNGRRGGDSAGLFPDPTTPFQHSTTPFPEHESDQGFLVDR